METKTANGVAYGFSEEGSVYMTAPKTINRYQELRNEHPKSEDYGVFFAFGDKQFEEGRQQLIRRGYMKEGEKVCSAGMGMYGTKAEISRYMDFYAERSKKIAAECDPQEVYFYECNNHECGYTWCDDVVVKIIADYFGKEAAHKVVRVYGGKPTNELVPMTERDEHLQQYEHTLMMLSRLKFDCEGFFNEGRDCRRRRPDCLWGGCVEREMQEMRKLYRELPDDIKDASCMSHEEIEDYCKRFEVWAAEEFSKPEYDPVPRTKRKDLPKEIYLDEKLYYTDDEGKFQTPDRIWFSHDSRRCHSDERKRHGRAYTSYLGKHGTTLAPVFTIDSDHGFRHYQLVRDDLCDVSCKYSYTPWIKGVGVGSRCYDFYYE